MVRGVLIRVAVVAVLAGSILLPVWSWKRLQPVSRQRAAAAAQQMRLNNEADVFERRWDPAQAERVEAQLKLVLERLFASPEEQLGWQTELDRQTRQHDIDVTSRLGATESRSTNGHTLGVRLATIELQPAAAARSTNSSYQRLMGFTRTLTNMNRRIDLVELSVTGHSNSVEQARATVQLWSREAQP
jgi:hypothetical protein